MKYNNLLLGIVSFLFASLLLISCSPYYQKLYVGPEQPFENLAFIVIDCSALNKCEYKIFSKIGNESVDLSNRDYKYSSEMITEPFGVLPGTYTVQIKASENNIFKLDSVTSEKRVMYGSEVQYTGAQYSEVDGDLCSVEFDIEIGKTFYIKSNLTTNEIVRENHPYEVGVIFKTVYSKKKFINIEVRTDYFFTFETTVKDGSLTVTSCSFDSKSGETIIN